MADYDFDYFVLGAGSGGVRSARIAAGHGARVGICEDRYLGGTCVNVGCVPKKLFSYAAHYSHDFEDSGGFGWTVGDTTHDWARMIANKNQEISRLNGVYRRLLEGAGVELIEGRAKMLSPHEVQIGDRTVTAEKILIATGGWPVVPDIPGAREHAITSNEAFYLEEMPKRVIVVGGGYIGVEFAGIFNGLGAETKLVYRGSLFLRGFDDSLRGFLAEELGASGIDLCFDANVVKIEKTSDCLLAHLTDGEVVETDCVMFATGRNPNTADLGLDAAGVALNDKGAVIVDADYRTNVPHIFAVGDVTDRVALTPVAIAEGHALADNLFAGGNRSVSYNNIPTAIFCIPPAATAGLTEAEARAAHGDVDIYEARFRPLKHTLSGRQERTFMKLIVEKASDRVVGCHMAGADVPEIVQGIAVAMNCGATKAQFDATIGLHPTAAEELVTMREPLPPPEKEAAD